uniref:Uncharacterized protein n=1 Tax=Nelumbo nucifera TaxID=4432 RepID=A0A822ZDD0_NELNU|nr:TPA_asm: hypothetical protein HUJ06_000750 [Nelumbo nucifera]
MFFFDGDEYVYVPPKNTIKLVLDSLSDYTQSTIEQMPKQRTLEKLIVMFGIEQLGFKFQHHKLM